MRHFFLQILFLPFLAGIALSAASSAQAATTIYTDSSNFGGWPNAVNSGNAIGPADGLTANVPNFGWIAFQNTPTFSAGNVVLNLASVTGSGTAIFYYGRTNGAGWFSALNNRTVTLSAGINILASTAAQTAYCNGLGGCDVFIVQAFGGGTSFNIDRVVGPTPEPSTWALMIIGFVGVAWRMKALRRRGISSLVPASA